MTHCNLRAEHAIEPLNKHLWLGAIGGRKGDNLPPRVYPCIGAPRAG